MILMIEGLLRCWQFGIHDVGDIYELICEQKLHKKEYRTKSWAFRVFSFKSIYCLVKECLVPADKSYFISQIDQIHKNSSFSSLPATQSILVPPHPLPNIFYDNKNNKQGIRRLRILKARKYIQIKAFWC